MANGRTRELTGLVRPEVEDRTLDRELDKIETGLDDAFSAAGDTLARAIPGGQQLRRMKRALSGGGGGSATGGGGGGTALGGDIQQQQLDVLEDIKDELEKQGVSAGGQGGGGGDLLPFGIGTAVGAGRRKLGQAAQRAGQVARSGAADVAGVPGAAARAGTGLLAGVPAALAAQFERQIGGLLPEIEGGGQTQASVGGVGGAPVAMIQAPPEVQQLGAEIGSDIRSDLQEFEFTVPQELQGIELGLPSEIPALNLPSESDIPPLNTPSQSDIPDLGIPSEIPQLNLPSESAVPSLNIPSANDLPTIDVGFPNINLEGTFSSADSVDVSLSDVVSDDPFGDLTFEPPQVQIDTSEFATNLQQTIENELGNVVDDVVAEVQSELAGATDLNLNFNI